MSAWGLEIVGVDAGIVYAVTDELAAAAAAVIMIGAVVDITE